MFNYVPKGIIQKLFKQGLWFLCMTRRIIVLYECMKFHRNILNGYQVIERTRFCDGQMDGRTDRWSNGRAGKNNLMSPDHDGGAIMNISKAQRVPQ